MSIDINAYLERSYSHPPCWQLVADVYQRELGAIVTEYKTINSDIRSIASAFRLALSKNPNGFVKVGEPQEHAVVLLGRLPRLGLHHCGIVIGTSVLHAVETGIGGVKYESLSTVLDAYPIHQFWARAEGTS